MVRPDEDDRVYVVDFDNTVTDAEKEGIPFVEGYVDDVATLSGLSRSHAQVELEAIQDEIASEPGKYGWCDSMGRIVAPATVDPYLRMMAAAMVLYRRRELFRDDRERDRVHSVLYRANYRLSGCEFRPGARPLVEAFSGRNAYFATNSDTGTVIRKLDTLGSFATEGRVFGGAKKYVLYDAEGSGHPDSELDADFHALPESIEIPGLGRPVYIRRPYFYKVSNHLRTKHGVPWCKVTFVGDILELDGVLGLELGAQFVLVANNHTPAYERAYVHNHPNGTVVYSLEELLVALGF